ncbi:MAG TPA: prolyl oligopeptidase family serine peptidase [Chryseolinea sp.]
MKNRRQFIKLGGLGIAGAGLANVFGTTRGHSEVAQNFLPMNIPVTIDSSSSIIGAYGPWAVGLNEKKLPAFSFRNSEFRDVDAWKERARLRLTDRLSVPDIGDVPEVKLKRQFVYDGLHIEELTWQLPYGSPTDAILLKPLNAKGKLPGILAFHDHAGLKYFGTRKITRVAKEIHPLMEVHQQNYYEGRAWANEIAKKGYVVLVSDAFPFASRRVLLKDVEPAHLRKGLTDEDPENTEQINAYNAWASDHEHIMSKALYSAGTTWPGVFFAEDKKALDILFNRPDVDTGNIGCAGLSGGGMRTVFLAGQDDRIKCAVCVGFMTTWRDFALHRAYTHTWMTYVPLLPNEMDFPEILGLRVPLPTMVLNDSEDQLFTLHEMKRADKILKDVFSKAGAEDRYKCLYYPGPHKFDRQMQTDAFAWFDRWLRA